ncbi:hypothetical protein [Mycobacterium kubicae]|uniref:hypothetical protein n=1 Tax=Mycobacterium kubicae TaxID=120959 RepID=UPI0007FEF8ED|nr:hypothetical protein [Mycobacterium kubicae]OBK43307.1 hypothetical protein A5657_05745 [Mycobacterium kubicae]
MTAPGSWHARDATKSSAAPSRSSTTTGRTKRRRWIAGLFAVLLTAGIVETWLIHSESEPCRRVRALIDFNSSQQKHLHELTNFPPAGSSDEPTVPTDADYQAWADGMQQRAAKVTTPQLAPHAQRAAELANKSLAISKQLNAEMDARPFLDRSLPPSATAFMKLNEEFVGELRALDRACPAA